MNQIFDLGEQLAELMQVSASHECRDIREMTPMLWSKFIHADALEMLKEKHFGGAVNRAKLLLQVKKAHLGVTTDDPEELQELNKALQYLRDIDQEGTQDSIPKAALDYLHLVEDSIDEIYYDVGTEIQECVDGFYTRGDLLDSRLGVDHKGIDLFICLPSFSRGSSRPGSRRRHGRLRKAFYRIGDDMLSFSPMAQISNPDFRVVIDLGETLGSFYRDLGDDRFDAVQDQFTGETSGYIARGLIHNLFKIPGGLRVAECCQFFPPDLQNLARQFLEQFWLNLSGEVARMEALVRMQNPGRHFDACVNPAPMIDGYSTLTIWYSWKSDLQVLQDNQIELTEEEPQLLGF